ncbi:MAG: ribosomal RNA small subunit methyltransferase A [Deltaproteobacteria bacterium]|nr:ribosomal RNA small subunit methyltransferase A [Deltaproteobacteria bacterium]MBW2253365.1 ribosomal RNA small subunit methyltransferase A [Deltaproteobacteria bacterium]
MSDTHPKDILRGLEQRARRRFGQHFLWRRDVVRRIVRGARVKEGDQVLEVGPGLGILTEALVQTGAQVTAVEVDRDLAGFIRDTFPSVRLVVGDALRLDLGDVCPGSGWKVVSNLPYNIGTPLVLSLVRQPATFHSLTVMLQKEVADRLLASPGTKAYGALTVQVGARARVRFVTRVPSSAFHPRPKVESGVVRLEILPEPEVGPAGPEAFDRVVRAAFSQRRKTIANSLGARYGKALSVEALAKAGIEASIRAERLDVVAYGRIAALLHPADVAPAEASPESPD